MANSADQDEALELESMLAPFLRTGEPRYRTARWLKSPFDAPTWIIENDSRLEIDWRILLSDGSLLTDTRHARLLDSLKSWPIARTHVDTTGGRLYARQSERNAVRRVLCCIDYLLLRSDALGLATYGLGGISQNDLKGMVATIGNQRSILTSVYEWPDRLTAYLRHQISTLSADAVDQALCLHNDLTEGIPDPSERLTSLDDAEIVLARAWLSTAHLYAKKNGSEYRLGPQLSHFVGALYSGTVLFRAIVLPVPVELCLGPQHRCQIECSRARVTSARDERMSLISLTTYIDAIAPLALLHAEKLDAPLFLIDELRRFSKTVDTKADGRFRTLPQDLVLTSLRRAVEFSIEYGDALVDSFLALALAAHDQACSISAIGEQEFGSYLTDRCRLLGIRRWTIEPSNTGLQGGPKSFSRDEWYRCLRRNEGLFESLRVLYGAIEVIVGTLMARRARELMDLVAGDCLDTSQTRLVFRNCKSGFDGMRERESRPIPPLGVRLVKLLERLQTGLIELGIQTARSNLFAGPLLQGPGLSTVCHGYYCEALDLFCDWIETPLDAEGKRYYLRQHQLRRSFAMLFFWGGGFGGMETLRWFLGHTKAEHLWHYITETTPGVTIRSIAAEWAAYGVRHATQEAELLGQELIEHFGTEDFSVLEEEALILHLEDLMEEGRLTIEPQFLDHGKAYRIAVLLRPKKPS